MPNTAKECIFCGSGGPFGTKGEHIYPWWFSKWSREMRDVQPDERLRGTHITTARSFEQETHYMALVSHLVCTTCNTGWMSALEQQALPIVKALSGDPRVQVERAPIVMLSREAQQILSTWFAMKAVTFHYCDRRVPTDYYTVAERTLLRTRLQIPPQTQVWLATNVSPLFGLARDCDLEFVGPYPGYVATLIFGAAAFQLLSHRVPNRQVYPRALGLNRAFLRIHPFGGVKRFAPPLVLGERALNKFAERWDQYSGRPASAKSEVPSQQVDRPNMQAPDDAF